MHADSKLFTWFQNLCIPEKKFIQFRIIIHIISRVLRSVGQEGTRCLKLFRVLRTVSVIFFMQFRGRDCLVEYLENKKWQDFQSWEAENELARSVLRGLWPISFLLRWFIHRKGTRSVLQKMNPPPKMTLILRPPSQDPSSEDDIDPSSSMSTNTARSHEDYSVQLQNRRH